MTRVDAKADRREQKRPPTDVGRMLASQRPSSATVAAPAAVGPARDSLRYCWRRA